LNIYVLSEVVAAWLAAGTTPESLQASRMEFPFNLPNRQTPEGERRGKVSASSSIKDPGFTPPCRWLIRQNLFREGYELAERLGD
jgi:hypothetical protein